MALYSKSLDQPVPVKTQSTDLSPLSIETEAFIPIFFLKTEIAGPSIFNKKLILLKYMNDDNNSAPPAS